jgi:hypothetical protein
MLTQFKLKLLPLTLVLGTALLSGCNSDDNKAPTISGDLQPVVAENTLEVGQYTATDPNNDTITLSLSGNDSELFTLSQVGLLSFNLAPDFEASEGVLYSLTITAIDDGKGKLSNSIEVRVAIGDVLEPNALAAVQTDAPDFSSSEVVYIDTLAQQVESGYYIKGAFQGYTISSYKQVVFHIGQYFVDTIARYNTDIPENRDTQVWEYSSQDMGQESTGNPYTLASLNDSKAYLIRYGSSKVWVVNPQATNSESFKIGELDLSSYDNENNTQGTANPAAAVINNGKLFIAMQRQDDAFAPGSAFVAVFDTETDQEIETNSSSEDNVKGIPLVGVNPLQNSLIAYGEQVFVTTPSSLYNSPDLSLSRIEVIDINDYSLREVLNANDISDNTSNFLRASAIVSAEQGYFYSTEEIYSPSYTTISTLYEFNPTTGDIINANVNNTGTESINFIDVDTSGFLWVSVANPEAPGIDVINTETNTLQFNRLPTLLNPNKIEFIGE